MTGPVQLRDDLWFFKSLRELLALRSGKLTDPFTENVWVYRCVMSWGTNVSTLPLLLKQGDRKQSEIVESHELVDLLAKPCPTHMTTEDFFLGTIISLGLDGEFFWIKESGTERRVRPGEVPRELWLVQPGRMKEKVTRREGLVGWEYDVGDRKIPYMPHEVIHGRFVNPRDPYRGLAPLKAATLEAEIDHAAATFNKAFFDNGAEVGVVLSTPQNLSKKQRDRELKIFEERHSGPDRRERPLLLAKGITLSRNTATHKDMAYQEGRKWSRSVILAAFSVPPTEVGIYDDVSRDKATVARKLYWENVLVPLAKLLASALNSEGLLGGIDELKEDHWFEWDFSGVDALKEGERERAEIASIYFKEMGVPLEVLNEKFDLGLPIEKIPHAKQSFLPVSLIPADMAGTEDPEPKEEEEDEPRIAAGATRDDKKLAKLWRALEARVFRPHEKSWQARVRSWFFGIRKEVLKAFDAIAEAAAGEGASRAPLTATEIETLLSGRRKWEEELRRRARPLYVSVAEAASESLEDELGGFTAFGGAQDPAVLELVATNVPRLAEGVTSTLAKKVREQLLQGLAENETVDQLRRRLTKTFNLAAGRALTIARTETATAVNGTRFAAFQAEGIERHQWVTAGDEHVREEHVQVNGEIRVVGEFFSNGLRFPNDRESDPTGKNTISCRCVTVAAPPSTVS